MFNNTNILDQPVHFARAVEGNSSHARIDHILKLEKVTSDNVLQHLCTFELLLNRPIFLSWNLLKLQEFVMVFPEQTVKTKKPVNVFRNFLSFGLW